MTDELPPGWATGQVNDIAVVNPPGSTVATTDDTLVSFLPMAAVTELTGQLDLTIKKPFGEVKKGFTRFMDGDVLFAKITPSMENGKVAVARDLEGGLGCGTTEFHVIRAERGVEPDYLRYYFVRSAYRQEARRNMQGAVGQQRVPPDFIRDSDISVAPAPEQKRIVSKIDELFSRIDEGERALERVQKLVERYRQSVLKAAVTGELTREWREKNKDKLEPGEALLARILKARREAWEKAELEKMKAKGMTPANDKWKQKYEEPSPPDTTDLPELPDGWTWASLGQLTKELDQGWSPQCASEPATQDGQDWGVIKTTAVQAMRYEGTANKALPSSLDPRPNLEVKPGDLLVTRAGPRSRVGIACLVRSTRPRLMICDKVYRLRVLDQLMSRDYVEIALNSPPLLEELEKLKSGINDSGLNLTQERFLALTVPLPSLAEQTRIADFVAEAGSEADGAATHASVSSDPLRQAILKLAFSGKLVEQSGDDEPASTLLERIAAERGADNAAPKRGRKKKTAA